MAKKKIKVSDLSVFQEISSINDGVAIISALQAAQPEMFTKLLSNMVLSVIEFNSIFYVAEHWALIKYLQQADPEKRLAIASKQKCKTIAELKACIASDLFFHSLLPNSLNKAMCHQQDLGQSLDFPFHLTTRDYAEIYHCNNSTFCSVNKQDRKRKNPEAPRLDETFVPEPATDYIDF